MASNAVGEAVPQQSCQVGFSELTFRSGQPTEFLDVTLQLSRLVLDVGLARGLLSIQSMHTTTALIVNENEPLLLEDMRARLDAWAPRSEAYGHDDLSVRTVNLMPEERRNGHAHCQALLLPVSFTLHVIAGRLHLGRWQRVFLVELDGPQARRLSVTWMGETLR